jgi:hypothetical protein
MSYEMLTSPVELTDDQLDFVAAGARQQKGLVNVDVSDVNVNVAVAAITEKTDQVFNNA